MGRGQFDAGVNGLKVILKKWEFLVEILLKVCGIEHLQIFLRTPWWQVNHKLDQTLRQHRCSSFIMRQITCAVRKYSLSEGDKTFFSN